MPYALYLRLHHREAAPFTMGLWEERGTDNKRLVYHGFMPGWQFLPDAHRGEGVTGDELAMPIGHALDEGWERLTRKFKTAHGEHGAVVFIGEFPDVPDEDGSDQHRSFLGKTTGSTMLIDLYHELERGRMC